jgi:hypothetical protein
MLKVDSTHTCVMGYLYGSAADLLNADSSSLERPGAEEEPGSADELRTRESIEVGEMYSPRELKAAFEENPG